MRKVRSNATWNGLSRGQRARLEEWLFEEGLSFNVALERAKKELGFAGSRTSLRRFYERARTERMLSGLTDAGELARTVEKSDVSVERLRDAGLKLAAEMFMRTVASEPENSKAWAPLAKLLLQAEKNESWRRVKEKENDIRDRTLDFTRLKFQYNTVSQAMRVLPKLKDLEKARQDPLVSELEENKMVNNIRRGMFGENIPGVLPETPEELAHPEILEAREKEAYARQMAIYARKAEERKREQEALREKAASATLAQAIENEKMKAEKLHGMNEGGGDEGSPDLDTGRWSKGDDGVYYPRGVKGGE